MGFLGLFQSKSFDPAEFEKELTAITQSISQIKKQIAQLTKKKKTLRRSVIGYSVAIYVAFVAYLYKSSLDNLGVFSAGMSRTSILLHGQSNRTIAGACIAPFGFAFVVYLINFLFNAWIRSKSHSLRNLQKKHREKLEELKQVTNFSKTDQLLKRFDGNSSELSLPDGGQHAKPLANDASKHKFEEAQNIPKSDKKLSGPPLTANIIERKSGSNPPELASRNTQTKQQEAFSKTSQNSGKRSFQDRILDLIIGSDHNESVEQRYALICANCYTHNGLAPPGCVNPNNVTYICRHCGFINGQLHLSSPVGSGGSSTEAIDKNKVTEDEVPLQSRVSKNGDHSLASQSQSDSNESDI